MRYWMKLLAVPAVLAGLGCAMTGVQSEVPQPTHRWVAVEDVSRAKYKLDNNTCIEQSAVQFHPRQAEAASDGAKSSGNPAERRYLHKGEPEFIRYERCMNQRGYNLASY